MKVWTDEVGINVAWDKPEHPKTMRPLRCVRVVSATVGVLMLCLAGFMFATGSAFGVAVDLTVGFMNAVVVTIQTYVIRKGTPRRSRPRLGELYLSELPGMLWILLAGAEYWKAAGRILERRTKKAEEPVVPPTLGLDRHAIRDLMGPLPPGYAPRRRHPGWICGYCAAGHRLAWQNRPNARARK